MLEMKLVKELIKVQLDLNKIRNSKYDGLIAKMDTQSDVKEYIVFNSNQFKSVDNKKPTKSGKING